MMRSSLILLSLAAAVCLGAPKSKDQMIPHAIPSSSSPREVQEVLDPGNGVDRGDWGDVDLCPTATVVSSFELKYASLGNIDDTAGNGLKLYCKDIDGSLSYVSSAEGLYGDWLGIRECSDPASTLVGVRLEVLGAQGNLHDDLGVTNVQMFCNGSAETLDGRYGPLPREVSEHPHMPRNPNTATREMVVLEDGRKLEKISANLHQLRESEEPSFGSWVQCTSGYTMCGLQTRVEPDHIVDDDAGLVDIIFFCC